jgi:hypothetical protein
MFSSGLEIEFHSEFSLEKVDWWNSLRISIIKSRPHPMQYLDFSNHEREI